MNPLRKRLDILKAQAELRYHELTADKQIVFKAMTEKQAEEANFNELNTEDLPHIRYTNNYDQTALDFIVLSIDDGVMRLTAKDLHGTRMQVLNGYSNLRDVIDLITEIEHGVFT